MEFYNKSKTHINQLINSWIKETPDQLHDILIDTFHGGKRLRPIIAYEINRKLNINNKTNFNIDQIILISEILHTCSLIIDDLPCMDNDISRRGLPTIHYKYGENKAQIITTYLINIVFKALQENLHHLEKQNLPDCLQRKILIYRYLHKNLGLFGAPFGQYLDLCSSIDKCLEFSYNKDKKSLITELINKKTCTFFEISFILSYIGSGGDLSNLNKMEECASSFGLAFQISDDFEDQIKDKSKSFCPNYVNHFGKEIANEKILMELEKCTNILLEIDLFFPVIDEVTKLLQKRVLKYKT